VTNAEARFNNSLRPRKPEGSLGRTAQDVHLDSHTAPELWQIQSVTMLALYAHHCCEYISIILILPLQKGYTENGFNILLLSH